MRTLIGDSCNIQIQRVTFDDFVDIQGNIDFTSIDKIEIEFDSRVHNGNRDIALHCIFLSCSNDPCDRNAPTALVAIQGAICKNSDIVLSGSTDVFNPIYRWYNSDPDTTENIQPLSFDQDLDVQLGNAGLYNYYLVVESPDGCMSESRLTQIAVAENLAITGVTNQGPHCYGSDIQLEAPTFVNAEYLWTGPNGFSSIQEDPVIFNADEDNEGIYTVQVKVGGCESVPTSTEVRILSAVQQPVGEAAHAICGNDSITLVVANPQVNTTYNWFGVGFDIPLGSTSLGSGSTFRFMDERVDENTEFFVEATHTNCTSEPSVLFKVPFDVPSNVIARSMRDITVCENNVWLEALNDDNVEGQWIIVDADDAIIQDPSSSHTFVDSLKVGPNAFSWNIISGACGITSSDLITVTYVPAPLVVDDLFEYSIGTFSNTMDVLANDIVATDVILSIVDHPHNGILSIENDNAIRFSPGAGFLGQDSFTYMICNDIDDCPDACQTGVATINLLGECTIDDVPNVITPNRDGINDAFILPIKNDVKGSLRIFNRWGDEIYHHDQYNNDWEGTWKDEILPVGTYYYMFEITNVLSLHGYIYIQY